MGRRTETTEELKGLIADALLKLLEQKPMWKIKVKEVTDLAGVGRVSYFRYFTSMENALGYKMSHLWMDWRELHPRPKNAGSRQEAEWIFTFFDSEAVRSMLAVLCRSLSTASLLEVFQEAGYPFRPREGAPPRYAEVSAAYSRFGILLEWARCGFAESPAELAQLCAEDPVSAPFAS